MGFYVVSMLALWRMFWLSEVIGEGSNGSIMDLGTDVMVVKSERGNNGSIVLEYASKQKVTFAFKKWASDYCLTSNEQFYNYIIIMAKTSYIRWDNVRFVLDQHA